MIRRHLLCALAIGGMACSSRTELSRADSGPVAVENAGMDRVASHASGAANAESAAPMLERGSMPDAGPADAAMMSAPASAADGGQSGRPVSARGVSAAGGIVPASQAGAGASPAGTLAAGAGTTAGDPAMTSFAGASGATAAAAHPAGSPAAPANGVVVAGPASDPVPCNRDDDCTGSSVFSTLWTPICDLASRSCGPCRTQIEEDRMATRVIACLSLLQAEPCAPGVSDQECLIVSCHRACDEL